jgi:molecular chaperone HscC
MIAGIDLGTSNSLISVFRDGAPVLVKNSLGDILTPSAVSVDDAGMVIVGEAAKNRSITHPNQTATTFKRAMGTNRAFTLGDQTFRADELSSLILGALKADAEAMFGASIDEVVVTVPAYFSDAQRQATRVAAQLAGLKVRRLLNEPTAAALAYGLLQNSEAEAKLLIIDLGGGTFDVSIIEKFEGIIEVRATAGDNFLGGEDFLDLIVERFMRDVPKSVALDADRSASLRARIRRKAETFKREATDRASATMSESIKDQIVSLTLNQAEITELYAPLLARLRDPIERALRDSRLAPQDITGVVLAGGATRMPDVRRLVARLFGRMPIGHVDPDTVVARGAATFAALLKHDEAFKEVVVTDVAPYSMGVDTVQRLAPDRTVKGTFLPIIERNSVIPISRVKNLATVSPGQTVVILEVYQGESRLIRDNIFLGKLHIPVPYNAKAQETFDVRFTYDRDGILEVEVIVNSTGSRSRAVFQNNPGTLSDSEIEKRLARLRSLKVHPRDVMQNVTALSRADRVYQEQLGPARAEIQQRAGLLTLALERQEQHEITRSREYLLAFLDHIEASGWTFNEN